VNGLDPKRGIIVRGPDLPAATLRGCLLLFVVVVLFVGFVSANHAPPENMKECSEVITALQGLSMMLLILALLLKR